jgi:hypothetical protein
MGSAKSVVIPTHESAGPNGGPWIEERLDFPASWDLPPREDMAGHNLPVLDAQQIAEQRSQPIVTKPRRARRACSFTARRNLLYVMTGNGYPAP